MKIKMLCKVDNENVRQNKKERSVKKECSENEIMRNALKDDVIKVKECEA